MGNFLSSQKNITTADGIPLKSRSDSRAAISDTTSEQSAQHAGLEPIPAPSASTRAHNKLQTEKALWGLKHVFETELLKELNLTKVSAPLIVRRGTGLNDTTSKLQPVNFVMADGGVGEIPRALSRWKRQQLKVFGLEAGDEGILVYMNGIRPDERDLDDTHSHYVDQWDWELPIHPEQRNLDTLKSNVRKIYSTLKNTAKYVGEEFGVFTPMPEEITFIHSSQLQREYPHLSGDDRETQACLKYGAVFIIGIGAPLADGRAHGSRSSDLDDWSSMTELGQGLNGDFLVLWGGKALELSSMSIRVDAEAMTRQLRARGVEAERKALPFVQQVLNNDLPQTIGGGIGISRVAMFLLQKRHIAEVQSSCWPAEMVEAMEADGIEIL